jgi:hypothetical protein
MIMAMVLVPQHHPSLTLRVGQMNEPRLIQQLAYTDPGFTLEQQVVALGDHQPDLRPDLDDMSQGVLDISFKLGSVDWSGLGSDPGE